MTSKLFHAVVGVGISLGSVAACGGSTSNDAQTFGLPDAKVPEVPSEGGVVADSSPPKLDAGAPDAASTKDATADVVPDAATVDAATADATFDAPQDAIVEAFCDVTWPITKSGREVCGSADECMGQPIPWCFGPDGQGGCKLYPLQCVGAEWHCVGGVLPTNDPEPPSCQ